MEKEILIDIASIMNAKIDDVKELKRFNQGMSNYTFKFKLQNDYYVYRKIGLDAFLFVNYLDEYNNLIEAYNSGLTSELIYFNTETGTKIQRYIEGSTIDFNSVAVFSKALVKSLKALHNTKSAKLSNYELIKRLNKYESYLDKAVIDPNYYLIKDYFIDVYNKYFKMNQQVFCHNDLQNINIIYSLDKITLIDFEYGGLNDIYYDFATFEENAFLVYELYYDKKISELEKAKINFYKMFSSLQWYLVATYKEIIGFSKLTNYDFKELANYFIEKSFKLYKQTKEVNFGANI